MTNFQCLYSLFYSIPYSILYSYVFYTFQQFKIVEMQVKNVNINIKKLSE